MNPGYVSSVVGRDEDGGALPQRSNTNLHRMVTNLSGQAWMHEPIPFNRERNLSMALQKEYEGEFLKSKFILSEHLRRL